MCKINFILNEQECKECKQFYKEHKNCCKNILGKDVFSTTGGELSFIITPTGLGNIIEVKCNSCGKTENITDVTNW